MADDNDELDNDNNNENDEGTSVANKKARQQESRNWSVEENTSFLDAMKQLKMNGSEGEKSTQWTALNVVISKTINSANVPRAASAACAHYKEMEKCMRSACLQYSFAAQLETNLQQQSRNFDCKGDQAQQLKTFASTLEWFDIYAKTKPTRDIAKLTTTLDTTVKEYQDRLAKGPVSPMYCSIKTKLINQQVEIISGSVQGRF